MTGRVFIVTGANSGLGFEVSRVLCESGNDVILACRNETLGNDAVNRIKQKNSSALATFMKLDLADAKSIREFVDSFHALGKRLDVLINNAGLALNFTTKDKQYTADGFELTIGTNYCGPFLLTNLLLEDLKNAAANPVPPSAESIARKEAAAKAALEAAEKEKADAEAAAKKEAEEKEAKAREEAEKKAEGDAKPAEDGAAAAETGEKAASDDAKPDEKKPEQKKETKEEVVAKEIVAVAETGSRVVNVVSRLHDPASMKRRNPVECVDLDDMFYADDAKMMRFSGIQAYKDSKAMLIMFTYKLARMLEGTGVTVNCVCPGESMPTTQLTRNESSAQKFFSKWFMHRVLRFTHKTRTIGQGAQNVIAAATWEANKDITGTYYVEDIVGESTPETKDTVAQDRLWDLTGGYLKMDGFEPVEVPEQKALPVPVKSPKKKVKEEKVDGSATKEDKAETSNDSPNEAKTDNEPPKMDEKEPEDKDAKGDADTAQVIKPADADDDLKKPASEETAPPQIEQAA